VPITHKDLARIIKATGKPANKIVRFCPDSEMEYDDESGIWIKFKSGKRAMVLRKKKEKCMFLTKHYECTIYTARPQTCRTFPYSIYFKDGRDRIISEISLNKVLDCNAKRHPSIDIGAVVADVRRENREDREYHRLVEQWNKSGEKGTTADFLQYIKL
jgi:Fe-S-cluster containining protein